MVPILFLRREGDSNPRYSYPYDSLANCWFQPLTHLSKADKKPNPTPFYQKRVQRYCFFFIYANVFAIFFCVCQKKVVILHPNRYNDA